MNEINRLWFAIKRAVEHILEAKGE